MNTKTTSVITALFALTLMAAVSSASAERDERRHDERRHDEGRHGDARGGWHGDIRHFDNHDYQIWREGSWHRARHEGRLGWWWVAAGVWYFYPQPVYPYPDPYLPPVVVVSPQPALQPAPALAAPAQSWYYCEASKSYYPYVSSCPAGWKTVPATPAGPPDR
jgi:hypothetical protein